MAEHLMEQPILSPLEEVLKLLVWLPLRELNPEPLEHPTHFERNIQEAGRSGRLIFAVSDSLP